MNSRIRGGGGVVGEVLSIPGGGVVGEVVSIRGGVVGEVLSIPGGGSTYSKGGFDQKRGVRIPGGGTRFDVFNRGVRSKKGGSIKLEGFDRTTRTPLNTGLGRSRPLRYCDTSSTRFVGNPE